MFSCEFCEIFKNTFLTEYLPAILFPVLLKTDLSPCYTVYIIDFEHVKTYCNITIKRLAVVIRKLEGWNFVQLKLYDARRVWWMEII